MFEGIDQISYQDVAMPQLAAGEALVQIKAASVNRRDWWISKGKYPGTQYPIIPGSDGAGIVTAVADGAHQAWVGKGVVIYPATNWGDNAAFQGPHFTITGLPGNGTFAQYVKVLVSQLVAKPAQLTWAQTACLPVAGLTAYRALFTKGQASSGHKVLIAGVGSGTGVFALQWAVAAGCDVYVTSGSDEKIARAQQLGAKAGVNYRHADWPQQLATLNPAGFDVIIDSALGDGFAHWLDLAKPGARIVFFGATAGNIPPLAGRKIFGKQLQLLGTMLGSPQEFEAMLLFVAAHNIVPVIDAELPLADAPAALAKMDSSTQFGKLVLEV